MWRSGIRKPPGLLRCDASLCGVSNKEDQMKTRKKTGDFAATLSVYRSQPSRICNSSHL